jgi:hypothetical protein
VLVETAFGTERFEARRELLEAGDVFRIEDPDPRNPTDGFVVADERPALTAAYRVGGLRGRRLRPGGGGYDVVVTTYQRILHDEFFQLLSWVLVFLAGLAAIGQLAASLKPDAPPVAASPESDTRPLEVSPPLPLSPKVDEARAVQEEPAASVVIQAEGPSNVSPAPAAEPHASAGSHAAESGDR